MIALAVRAGTAIVAGALLLSAAPAAQRPTFRSAVDLIAVEAQVVDETGTPVSAMTPADFEVSLNGRRRRVVSADFTHVEGPHPGELIRPLPPVSTNPGSPNAPPARTFILAIDASSFEIGAAKGPLDAAREFVSSLPTSDHLGLYVYPTGPRIVPGEGRALVRQALTGVVGSQMRFNGKYHLRPSEVVDITGAFGGANPGGIAARVRASQLTAAQIDANPVFGVQARECPDDPECGTRIISEASAMALHLEGQLSRSLTGLEALLRALSDLPGRKTVVLVTAGLIVSDRPGGRPDVGDLSRVLGQRAAAANAVVYTVYAESSFTGVYGASPRRVADVERERDRSIAGDWLDRFSAAAGGFLINVPIGSGEFAFARVLRETSAYYLLGVEPAPDDRDGRPRELRVKLNRKGLTVRNRQWVVVPRAS
jgi:VWFA-related protein